MRARYRARVERIAAAERRVAPGETALATEVAHSLFKLMAIKDEYEVARLYTDGAFERQLARGVCELGAGWNSTSRRRCSRAATSAPAT